MKKQEMVKQTRDGKVLVQAQTTVCGWRGNFKNYENTRDYNPVNTN